MDTQLQRNRQLTDRAWQAGVSRAHILRAARPLLAQGGTFSEVAALVGTSPGQLCKLRERFAHLKDDELTPENLAGHYANCGRRSQWAGLAEDPAVQQRLKQLYLATTGASSEYLTVGRRTGSLTLALESFAHDPLCPPDLRTALLAGTQPEPLKRLVRAVTPELEQRHRGHRHLTLHGTFRSHRERVEVDELGRRHQIQPGDWWVFDDMSSNLPHWFPGPDGTPLIGRQGLYAYDLTGKWLGLEKVGTPRDSYSAAIILRFIRRLMQHLGKPRRGIVLEQSVWKARSIAGLRLGTQGEPVNELYQRPALAEADRALIQEGLAALGIRIHYTHTPRGKEIESAFNYLQRVLGVMAREHQLVTGHELVHLGRHRGEFEAGAKALRRARAGSHHPQDLGFLSLEQAADLEDTAMQRIDARKGKRPESAQAAYARALQAQPLAPLVERDLAAFLPQSHTLEIRGGRVVATVEGTPYAFSHGEVFAALGTGYRLHVRFDPTEPALGAAIYNRETSSANHHGWQDGQFITWAEYIPPVARFDWRTTKEPNPQRQGHDRFVRTAFRAIGLPHAATVTARDGHGQVIEVTRSTPGSEPAANPPLRPRGRRRVTLEAPSETEVTARRARRSTLAAITEHIFNEQR